MTITFQTLRTGGNEWLIDDSNPNPLSALSLEELDYPDEVLKRVYAKEIEKHRRNYRESKK